MNSYTLIAAAFANAEHTAAIVTTVEAGAVAASLADTPDLWARMLDECPPTPYAPAEPLAPRIVRAWAAKAVLSQHGLLDQAEAAAASAGGSWPFRFAGAPDWTREDALTLGVGGMGLTAEQVDALLLEAAALT